MASLPADRLSVEPPFTHVGLNVFGPWNVTSRCTRAKNIDSKRWAVMFTCLGTRAVHIVLFSTDPETPAVRSPEMLLTQKAIAILAPPGDFELKQLYKAQWRQVQGLTDYFWRRWRQ